MDSLTSRTAVVPPVVTERDPIRAQLYMDVLSLFRASHGCILTCTCAHRYTPGRPLSIKGPIVCLVLNSLCQSALSPLARLHAKHLQGSVDCSKESLSSTQGPQVDCTLVELSWAGWAALLQVVGQLGLAPDCGSGSRILLGSGVIWGVLFSRRIPGAMSQVFT